MFLAKPLLKSSHFLEVFCFLYATFCVYLFEVFLYVYVFSIVF